MCDYCSYYYIFFLQRCGVWGDWENPYLTLHPDYEAAQVVVKFTYFKLKV